VDIVGKNVEKDQPKGKTKIKEKLIMDRKMSFY
jgi:hypothetical protein